MRFLTPNVLPFRISTSTLDNEKGNYCRVYHRIDIAINTQDFWLKLGNFHKKNCRLHEMNLNFRDME